MSTVFTDGKKKKVATDINTLIVIIKKTAINMGTKNIQLMARPKKIITMRMAQLKNIKKQKPKKKMMVVMVIISIT